MDDFDAPHWDTPWWLPAGFWAYLAGVIVVGYLAGERRRIGRNGPDPGFDGSAACLAGMFWPLVVMTLPVVVGVRWVQRRRRTRPRATDGGPLQRRS